MADKSDMTLSPRLRQDLFERLAPKKDQIFWIGMAMTAVGLLSLLFPVLTSLTVELMVGWLLLFAGAATVFGAFSMEGAGTLFGQLLLGLLKLAMGVYLIMHPAFGMVALTLMLAAIFMVDGAAQIAFSLNIRPKDGWVWVMLSGVISIVAGLLIAAGLPGTSLIALGILVGINFLSTGMALVMLSRSLAPKP